MEPIKKYLLGFFLLFDLAFASSLYHEWHVSAFKRTIRADGLGYNAYLPAMFIHDGNLHWNYYDQFLKKSFSKNDLQDFRKTTANKKFVNKYSIGLAITQAPLWLLAHLIAPSGSTGYEAPYQIAVWLNNFIWLMIGLYLFGKLLVERGQKVAHVCALQGLILFGTNVFHFITFDQSYTHTVIIGLGFIALYSLTKWLEYHKIKYFIGGIFSLGMILLLRPIDILLMPWFIFFVFSHPHFSLRKFTSSHLVALILTGITIGGIYLGSLYLQTGTFWVYSYGNEKFYFNQPHLFELLFGYRSGLFLYAPMLLFLWFYASRLKDRRYFIFSVVYFLFCVWILSCWSEHWYGCRLGNRPLLDFIPLMSIPLLFVSMEISKNQRKWMIPLALFFIYYNQILHYQYRHYLIDWCDVKKEQFWNMFLRTHKHSS